MDLIRDIEKNKISFLENDKEIMYMCFFADEFCWVIDSKEVIEITEDMDPYFYNNLKSIMSNDYKFEYPEHLTHKTDSQISWYSDAYGDIENECETDLTSRLNIKLENDIFYIWAYKPIYIKNNINKSYHCICFSPSGNGQTAINSKTGTNFQDDVITKLLFDTLNKRDNKQKKIYKNPKI